MNEAMPGYQSENHERSINLSGLGFDALRAISREMKDIEAKTFRRVENGFENVGGETIRYRQTGDKFIIVSLPQAQEFHRIGLSNEVLRNGTTKESELVAAIRQVIEEAGGRIIE